MYGAVMIAPALHPSNAALISLLGTWTGSGEGSYPTIDNFSYDEELSFGHSGKPFVALNQRTRSRRSGIPLHAEAGYFRPQSGGSVELVLAQPSGILEVLVGVCQATEVGLVLDLRSDSVVVSPSAKVVTETRRRFSVDGDTLTIDMWMAAMGEPLTHHLNSVLRRD